MPSDLAALQIDDRLGVQHEAVLIECVPDRAHPGEGLELAFSTLLLGPASADVAEDDDDSGVLVDGDRCGAVAARQRPPAATREVIVLVPDGRACAQRAQQWAV